MSDHAPLDTDSALLAFANDLIGPALRRQTWLFPLDDDHRTLAAVAIDDMPVDPDPDDVEHFGVVLRGLIDQTDAASVVVIWERPGGPDLGMQEADWAAGLAATGVPLRAQLLAHDDGVRLLDPAFEALVA